MPTSRRRHDRVRPPLSFFGSFRVPLSGARSASNDRRRLRSQSVPGGESPPAFISFDSSGLRLLLLIRDGLDVERRVAPGRARTRALFPCLSAVAGGPVPPAATRSVAVVVSGTSCLSPLPNHAGSLRRRPRREPRHGRRGQHDSRRGKLSISALLSCPPGQAALVITSRARRPRRGLGSARRPL